MLDIFKVVWDAPKSPPYSIDEYMIGCTIDPNSVVGIIGRVNGKKTSFTYAGLKPETTYYCEAFSWNEEMKSSGGKSGDDIISTTTKNEEKKPLEITEDVAKDIVTTNGKVPLFKSEEVKSVKDNVVTGTKAGKLIGIFPVNMDISVEINKQTLEQKVSKPFWTFLVMGL